jgi:hypothetical protein
MKRSQPGCSTLVALAVLIGVAPVAHAVITQTVNAKADAYVRSVADKKSFGFENQLELRMSAQAGASEGYVQFPLPQHAPFSEKIVVRLYAQLAEPGAMKVMVRSVAPTPWTELGLTWKTRPEHKDTLATLNVVGLSGSWYEADVTAFVRSEAARGAEAVTLALVPGEESKNRLTVQTHESAEKKPEMVFSRQPLSVRLSFQPTNAVPPTGYLADNGWAFRLQTNGFSYGWSKDNTGFMRDRNNGQYKRDAKNPPVKAPDRRYDFLAYMDYEKMPAPVSWEMAVPNSTYRVRLVAGDAQRFDSIFRLTAENVTVIDGIPDAGRRWLDATATVVVTDGRLSIGHGAGASNNKLCFLELSEVENLLTQAP